MKITIVQGAFFPVPPIMGGAVEKVWHGLGEEFARRGHQVTHISRTFDSLPYEEYTGGVRHIRIPGYNSPKSLTVLKLMDLLYTCRAMKVLPEADVLVSNTFWLPLLSRNKKYGKLYVHVARYPKGQMKWYRHAGRLQAVSKVIGDAIAREQTKRAATISVIPNPLPPAAFSNQSTETGTRKPWILYVGRIHPEKGIELLIQAYGRMKNRGWRLVIVGPWEEKNGGGGSAYKSHLDRIAEAHQGEIDWIGPVFDAAKLKSFYEHSAIFVYPSLAEKGEALPLAPLEAMAAGCVPVVSEMDCFRDYLRSGENGRMFSFKEKDPASELAGVLDDLIEKPEVRNQLGSQAVTTARNFALSNVATRYLEDFEKMVNECLAQN